MDRTRQADNNRIESFQALRGLAFMGIFLCHAGACIEWSALSVSVFFVLSGFLLTVRQGEEELPVSFRECFRFARKRISKLYLLHLVTMGSELILRGAILLFEGAAPAGYARLAGETVLHVFLLQVWFPDTAVNTSLNGVSWYLSAMAFFYFLFPAICRWIRKKDHRILIGTALMLPLLQVLLCVPWLTSSWAYSSRFLWFSYFFPVFRAGDFLTGCILGKLICTDRKAFAGKDSVVKATLEEAGLTLLTVLIYLWVRQPSGHILLEAAQNHTTVYLILAAGWILLFLRKGGAITKVLCRPPFVWLGNLSTGLFLIHFVVIRWISCAAAFLLPEQSPWLHGLLMTGAFALSVAAALLWKSCFPVKTADK